VRKKDESSPARYLTPPQIAAQLGVKPDRVLRWIRTGVLSAINLSDGRLRPRFRVAPSDLEIFLSTRRVAAPTRVVRRPRQDANVIAFF